MAENQLCHIVSDMYLPFNQGCFKSWVTSVVKSDNETPDQLIYTQQLIFLKIIFWCFSKTH